VVRPTIKINLHVEVSSPASACRHRQQLDQNTSTLYPLKRHTINPSNGPGDLTCLTIQASSKENNTAKDSSRWYVSPSRLVIANSQCLPCHTAYHLSPSLKSPGAASSRRNTDSSLPPLISDERTQTSQLGPQLGKGHNDRLGRRNTARLGRGFY